MGRSRLVRDLRRMISDGKVRRMVSNRIKTFREVGKHRDRVFSELCFCILTANYSAEGGLRIQKALSSDFKKLSSCRLAKKLRSLGYRYPRTRAKYIVETRKMYSDVCKILREEADPANIREWLADNVSGIGLKEASHFLRNTGSENLAIVDKHVLRVLRKYGLIKDIPKTLSRSRYLEIEKTLAGIACELGVSLSELDLYIWYMDTGKILK